MFRDVCKENSVSTLSSTCDVQLCVLNEIDIHVTVRNSKIEGVVSRGLFVDLKLYSTSQSQLKQSLVEGLSFYYLIMFSCKHS